MKRATNVVQRLRTEAETIISMRRDHPGYGTSPIFLNEVADEIERLRGVEAAALRMHQMNLREFGWVEEAEDDHDVAAIALREALGARRD